MLIQLLISVFITIFNIFTSWIPKVATLPTIGGYDIDKALVDNIGYFYTFKQYVFPIAIVWEGFLVLLFYYGVKMFFKLILGHRAPGAH